MLGDYWGDGTVSILEVALGLKNQSEGLSDPWSDAEDVAAWMRKRLDTWTPSSPGHERFYAAVVVIIEEALDSYGESLRVFEEFKDRGNA